MILLVHYIQHTIQIAEQVVLKSSRVYKFSRSTKGTFGLVVSIQVLRYVIYFANKDVFQYSCRLLQHGNIYLNKKIKNKTIHYSIVKYDVLNIVCIGFKSIMFFYR